MSNISLYHATLLAELGNFIDDDGVIDIIAFHEAKHTLVEKQRAVVAWIKNKDAELKMLDGAIKDLTERKASMLNKNTLLKSYLIENMKKTNTTEINAMDGTFTAKLYLDRDKSIQFIEGVEVPIEFCTVKQVVTPSKTLVEAAINDGKPVGCAVIVKKDRLTIS